MVYLAWRHCLLLPFHCASCATHSIVLCSTGSQRTPCHPQAESQVSDINEEIARLEDALKRDDLSEFDRNALLAQLKAAKVRLALEEQRRRRAAERKLAIRLGNQQLALKLLRDEEVEVRACDLHLRFVPNCVKHIVMARAAAHVVRL